MTENNGHAPDVTIRTVDHTFWELAIASAGGVDQVKANLQRMLDGMPGDPMSGHPKQPGLRERLAERTALLIAHVDTPEDDRSPIEHDENRVIAADRKDKLCLIFHPETGQPIVCHDCWAAYLEGECRILLGQIKRIESRLSYSDTFVEKLKESV